MFLLFNFFYRKNNHSLKKSIELIQKAASDQRILKSYVRGEYTFVDPKSSTRAPLKVQKTRDMTKFVMNSFKQNPRGLLKSKLIPYVRLRNSLEPSDCSITDILASIEACIDKLIKNKIIEINERNNRLFVSREILDRHMTDKNYFVFIYLCKISTVWQRRVC